jgi:eukaryotic-like serine/threonine-protein kinase
VDEATRQDDPADTVEIPQDIDETCDRFEAAWRAGERPQLEDHLGAVAGSGRAELLRHLLAVELAYRNRLGEHPQAAAYRSRFPRDDGLIEAAFAAASHRFRADDWGGRQTSVGPMGHGADGADVVTLVRSKPVDRLDSGHPGRKAAPAVPGYEISSELGRGGMGVVYKARQLGLNRPCALKMILAGAYSDVCSAIRFLTEAETVAKLRHPNVVQIYSLGNCDGNPFFEMEYVDGGSLAQRLDGAPWLPHPAARLVETLAWAIEEAHRRGIVHRDLKPSNVLLTADGTPKIGDFGLAKSLAGDSGLTQSGDIFGSPSYMAPEQAEGMTKAVSPAADIYSLGAILYELLTGRPPFKAVTVLQTLDQVRSQEPVSPTRLQPSVPRDLETICLKCLHKDPRRRYAGAGALAEDLDRFLSGRPILARSTGAVERGWKWARRRPAVALLSAAVVAVTVLGFALVAWLWRGAERARRDAVEKQAQLTLYQGLALCDRGEVGRGLLWLTRSLELATEANATDLGRTIRVNLADWGDQLIRPRRLPTLRHSETERVPILGCVFRRDGRTLVSVGNDRVARTWDTATGEEIGPPLEIEPDPAGESRLGRATFDPPEGGLLVAVDDRGRVTSWDLDRWRRSAPPLVLPPGQRVREVAFSPNLHRFVASFEDGTLQWRDSATLAPIGGPRRHGRGEVTTMALSRDGRTLATGGDDRQVIRWDVATGERLEPELFYDAPVAAIALAPDGRRIITGTRAGQLHIWDVDSGRGFDLPPQGTGVTSLAVSADGRVFASGTEAGVIRVWDAMMFGQLGQTIKLSGAVGCLAFDPGGTTLAMGGDDGLIRLYEVPRGQALSPSARTASGS